MANYRISELDFDSIKENLKQFLVNYRDKDNNLIFKDYDFDASSLSILLDLLSYNTHYNAYLANMVANEMFLDSAVKRQSAVSIAKHLGYTPMSYRSAKAKISFNVPNPPNNPTTLTLPRYSRFTTVINGSDYIFVNLDPITIKPIDGLYNFTDVEIIEGEPLQYSYRVDLSGPSEKYVIPNINVDTSTIRVTVQNSYADTTSEQYTQATDLYGITPTSKIFYLEENPSGFYEIFFGDGSLGQKLSPGNIVVIEYLVSHGDVCNVSNTITQEFSLGGSIGGTVLRNSITATTNSSGGDVKDTIDEIKFKAPRFASSTNRAVTAADYKSIIEANYPLVESISVWGGEDNDPPKYGKVMISLKPYEGYVVSDTVKTSITKNILANKKVMSVIPEFVDPKYLYINIDAKVKFAAKNSKYTAPQIELLTKGTIENYFKQDLQKFNKNFIYSKLSKLIDSINQSIIGSVLTVKLQKRIQPVINAENGYTDNNSIKFANKLVTGSISSSAFYYNTSTTGNVTIDKVYIQDTLSTNTSSTLNLIDFYSNQVLITNLGTVNYSTGTLSFNSLNPAGYVENSSDIRIYAKTEELDINSTNDMILVIDDTTTNTEIKQSPGLTITILTE